MKTKIKGILVLAMIFLLAFTSSSMAVEIEPRTSTEDGVMLINETEGNAVVTSEGTSEGSTTEEGTTEEGTEGSTEDVVYEDLFVIQEEDYEMNLYVDGHAYIMCSGNVKITGEIYGSLYVLASDSVEIDEDAYVADSIYAVTQELTIAGAVYDVYAYTEKYTSTQSAYIIRDIHVIAQEATLRGIVYRNVNIDCDNISVKSEEEENSSSLMIGGNFNYKSLTQIEGINELVYYGEVNYTQRESLAEETESVADIVLGYFMKAITTIVYVALVYLLIKCAAPKFAERTGKDLKEKGIVDFAVGLLSWVVGTILLTISIILAFTGYGLPVSFAYWVLVTIVVFISTAVVSVAVAEIVKEKSQKVSESRGLQLVVAILAGLVLWVLTKVPVIGGWMNFIIMSVGIGLVVRNVFERKEKTPVEVEAKVETETEVKEEKKLEEKTDKEEK